jgi:hypothetical protein
MSDRHLRAVDDQPRSPAEIVAERLRILEEFIAEHGMDYWSWDDAPPKPENLQLGFESEAA